MKNKNIAILYILLAALGFAGMNLFVKLAGDLPTFQKCLFRNLVAMIFTFVVLVVKRKQITFPKDKRVIMPLFCRCFFGTLGIILNFYAIDRLNISDASMLNKLSPFFAILFSLFLLKEKPNKVEIIAVIIAFIGSLFIIKPSFSLEVVPAISGFFGGMCAGLAYACVRKLGTLGVKGTIIVFCFSAFSVISCLPFTIAFYQPMTWLQLLYLMLAGCSATVGQVFITAAYQKAPAKEISVFDYAQVIFAAILGFFFLDQIPDYLSFIGYAIIIATAFAKWFYDMRKIKRETENVQNSDNAETKEIK